MKNSLRFILILAFSMFLIGCMFEKSTKDVPVPLNESSNEKVLEKSDEITKEEANKNSNETTNEIPDKTSDETPNEESKEKPEENKIVTNNKKKIVYLTFDDGPSHKVTSNVLDILKEKKVKATFFLIGNQIKGREDIVKRIYNEGNSLGLHSYTHNYKKLYDNDDSFIKEMIDCRKEIQRVVGISPDIIRFPGGSYRRMSRNLLKRLHDNNFKVYDWNMDNCDGLKPQNSPDELFTKATSGSENKDSIILLLHCTGSNQNTCTALPKIIEYYKSHGYEFKVITKETKELYAPITK
ncbi:MULTISPECIES: polysaccharide deacetylase family protein [unclassified Clostridium]|uniref:polysaccharide deacetylase family protein n=1 Tax=unclassified Clostridium TaxID=2614128 RepID=UPI0002978CD7|nr:MULTISPECIES: polysaccharide deacetylase family protein [unclassified Clostridium]EKQ57387.1 MAG: putative xylanase/chitin deacetylase [Clostridium sp. Maddingley MBC34-26]